MSEPALVTPPRFAVFGQPIAHSRSPFIHARFAQATRIEMRYDAIEAGLDDFADKLARFKAEGGVGANVTLPLKALAAELVVERGPHAQRAGVVNTLSLRADGQWRGDLTDGLGLVCDITERHRLDLRGRRTLMLGAGGAAQAVIGALIEAGVESVTIANRTPEKADALADRIGEPGRVHTVYWHALKEAGAFDFVLNCTAAGHRGQGLDLPFSLLTPRSLVYDMNYGKAAIDFLAWGRGAGCQTVFDGAGMLVEQAAESFRMWHRLRPDTDPVYAALRVELERG
jgi:shikimate dehydrogenase